MPTYEFLCEKCKKSFELSCSVTEYERNKKKGIKCASVEVQELFNKFPVFRLTQLRRVRS
jgi:putative FmdB family regulatory protein